MTPTIGHASDWSAVFRGGSRLHAIEVHALCDRVEALEAALRGAMRGARHEISCGHACGECWEAEQTFKRAEELLGGCTCNTTNGDIDCPSHGPAPGDSP